MVCALFKSQQTFSLCIGVFTSFDFEFKLSEVFILKKAQKVLKNKDRLGIPGTLVDIICMCVVCAANAHYHIYQPILM